MRALLLSDIHGNIAALTAVMEAAKDQYDSVICLGDSVGYYPDVSEVISILMSINAVSVMGNHECGVLEPRLWSGQNDDYSWAQAAQNLSREQLAWLSSLPMKTKMTVNGLTYHALHSSPIEPNSYIYPDTEISNSDEFDEKSVFLMGHTHIQMLRRHQNVFLVNPGSVGQPRNGKPGADFALLDFDNLEVSYRHVNYDVEAYAESLRNRASKRALDLLARVDESRFTQNPCGTSLGAKKLEFRE